MRTSIFIPRHSLRIIRRFWDRGLYVVDTVRLHFSLSSSSLISISFNKSFELSRMKLAPLAPDLLDWTEMKLTLRQCPLRSSTTVTDGKRRTAALGSSESCCGGWPGEPRLVGLSEAGGMALASASAALVMFGAGDGGMNRQSL